MPAIYRHIFKSSTTRLPAQVVELVDTLVSGTSGRKAVQVQVLSWVHVLIFKSF